jgi:hypothetical protein
LEGKFKAAGSAQAQASLPPPVPVKTQAATKQKSPAQKQQESPGNESGRGSEKNADLSRAIEDNYSGEFQLPQDDDGLSHEY